jgi:hypothetical protein
MTANTKTATVSRPDAVIGASGSGMMTPSQTIAATAISKMARRQWPM